MSEQQFRSAVGGFHRQDVLDYIEKTAKAHADELDRLRRELEEARAAQADAETECVQIRENLKACAASLTETRDALEERTAALAASEKRAAALAGQLEQLKPAIQAYEAMKRRMAEMEAAAQQRTDLSGAAAGRKAELTCMQLERWVRRVQAGYDRLRTDVDATMGRASGELERIRRNLDGVALEFAENDATLEELLRIVRDTEGPSAPQPLRLDGE